MGHHSDSDSPQSVHAKVEGASNSCQFTSLEIVHKAEILTGCPGFEASLVSLFPLSKNTN